MDLNLFVERIEHLREIADNVTGVAGLAKSIGERISGNSKADKELRADVMKLIDEAIEFKEARLAMIERLMELEQLAKQEQAFENTLKLYAPTTLNGGGVVLRLRSQDNARDHFETVCPVCVQDRKKYVPIQPSGRLLECPSCNAQFENEKSSTGAMTVPVRNKRWDSF